MFFKIFSFLQILHPTPAVAGITLLLFPLPVGEQQPSFQHVASRHCEEQMLWRKEYAYLQMVFRACGAKVKSINQGKMDSARNRNGGGSTVGNQTTTTAQRVASSGFGLTYSGGSFGTSTIYYEALGCKSGDFCSGGNNTNNAFIVRTGFYSYYYACGGPQYCWLGFPTCDEYSYGAGTRQTFQNGWLYWVR